jgi:nucleotide-binding universal stress UspA family protein
MNCKKILIAFDGSENAFRAVNYVGEVIGGGQGFTIVLLHVERLPDRDMFADEESWMARCKEQEAEMRHALGEAKAIIAAKGQPKNCVEERYIVSCRSPFHDRPVCSMGTSVAMDILRLQKEEDFGAVVIGRRGVSKQEEFLFGSVSSKIVHHARGCAVWVVE